MKTWKISLFLIGMFSLFYASGCQDKASKPNPELLNIELLRGDIIRCGGDEFGEVSFALGCKDSVRETFDLALSLLHSFEYDEAEKAFVKVIDADPDCAMAYWGVAMSLYNALWAPPSNEKLEKGSKLLKIAASLPKTAREQAYLDAIQAYYTDWENVDAKTRASRLAKKMEAVYVQYKDDLEAAIFYALTLNATADPTDKTYANQRKAGQILEPILAKNPNHPGISHYIIHSYDNPQLAEKALSTARAYAAIAPASAHAQHMPSHIFIRLGLWEEAISSNLKCTSSALCYAESARFQGHWDEELHCLDYLAYAHLQRGDNSKAIELNAYMDTIKKVYPVSFKAAYAFAAIPSRIALENKDWKSAATLEPSNIVPWDQFPWQKSIVHFTKALGSIHLGDTLQAKKEIQTLQILLQNLLDKNLAYEANQVQNQLNAAQAWLHFANGDRDMAVSLMREAADTEDNTLKRPVTPCEVLPARELLADLYLAMKKTDQALEAYQQVLENNPNRLNALYGAAITSRQLGKREAADSYFEQLIKLTESVDSNRPEIAEAKVAVIKI